MPIQASRRTQIRSDEAQHGSATHTITPTPNEPSSNQSTLRLRGAADPSPPSRRIRWAEDVVDNEGMGKKSSKVCCVYHPPRPAGESSSESDSSSSSDEDSDVGDDGDARPTRRDGSGHEHKHSGPCEHQPGQNKDQAKGAVKNNGRKRSPNAYEKMPKGTVKQ